MSRGLEPPLYSTSCYCLYHWATTPYAKLPQLCAELNRSLPSLYTGQEASPTGIEPCNLTCVIVHLHRTDGGIRTPNYLNLNQDPLPIGARRLSKRSCAHFSYLAGFMRSHLQPRTVLIDRNRPTQTVQKADQSTERQVLRLPLSGDWQTSQFNVTSQIGWSSRQRPPLTPLYLTRESGKAGQRT